jgi:hypothetical protein
MITRNKAQQLATANIVQQYWLPLVEAEIENLAKKGEFRFLLHDFLVDQGQGDWANIRREIVQILRSGPRYFKVTNKLGGCRCGSYAVVWWIDKPDHPDWVADE